MGARAASASPALVMRYIQAGIEACEHRSTGELARTEGRLSSAGITTGGGGGGVGLAASASSTALLAAPVPEGAEGFAASASAGAGLSLRPGAGRGGI
eukprot:1187305-Prorocentrum_minimum.AAC.2